MKLAGTCQARNANAINMLASFSEVRIPAWCLRPAERLPRAAGRALTPFWQALKRGGGQRFRVYF